MSSRVRQLVDLEVQQIGIDRIGAAGTSLAILLQRTFPVTLGEQRIPARLGIAGGEGAGGSPHRAS